MMLNIDEMKIFKDTAGKLSTWVLALALADLDVTCITSNFEISFSPYFPTL